MSAQIVVRRCPVCGGELLGRPGLEWFTCLRCPLALDPFHSPPRQIETRCPKDDLEKPGPRLPVYRFQLGRGSIDPTDLGAPAPPTRSDEKPPFITRRSSIGGRSPRETAARPAVLPRRVVWVNAFRVIGLQIHGDVGARLTAEGYAPELAPAPLGAGLARGPGEALRLLRRRHGVGQQAPVEVLSVALVALICRIEGTLVREPLSNLVYPHGLIRPPFHAPLF